MFNFIELCRLCTSNTNVSLTLSSSDSDDILISDKLDAVIPGIIQYCSELPVGICTRCTAQLNIAYKFINQCCKSQEILNNNLKQLQSKRDIKAERINECNVFVNNCDETNNPTKYNKEEKSNFESIYIKQENVSEYNLSRFCESNLQYDTNIKENKIENYYLSENSGVNIDFPENSAFASVSVENENEIKVEEHFLADLKNEVKLDLGLKTNLPNQENCSLVISNESGNSDTVLNNDQEFFDVCYTCKICEESFADIEQLAHHTRSAHKKYLCKICEKVYYDSSNLKVHFRTHSNERPYKCYVCEKSFKNNSHLKKHSLTHSNGRPFKCHICDKGFNSKTDLKRHLMIHQDERPHKCQICERTFKLESKLKEHNRIHTSDKPYKCEFCDKTFIRNSDLDIHVRTHTKQRSYVCKICGKTFIQNSHLHAHLRTHSNEKPFECEMCGKPFSKKCNLERHMLIHTHERPFKCILCEKTFTRKEYLKEHFRTAHKDYDMLQIENAN